MINKIINPALEQTRNYLAFRISNSHPKHKTIIYKENHKEKNYGLEINYQPPSFGKGKPLRKQIVSNLRARFYRKRRQLWKLQQIRIQTSTIAHRIDVHSTDNFSFKLSELPKLNDFQNKQCSILEQKHRISNRQTRKSKELSTSPTTSQTLFVSSRNNFRFCSSLQEFQMKKP